MYPARVDGWDGIELWYKGQIEPWFLVNGCIDRFIPRVEQSEQLAVDFKCEEDVSGSRDGHEQEVEYCQCHQQTVECVLPQLEHKWFLLSVPHKQLDIRNVSS